MTMDCERVPAPGGRVNQFHHVMQVNLRFTRWARRVKRRFDTFT